MEMIIQRVRNNTDRAERKYREKNLVHCHNLSTTYPGWNVVEPNRIRRVQGSANNRLNHETASFDVRVH